MKTLTTALGALTAVVLLAGCTHYYYDRYYDRYGYGYGYFGDRYAYGYGRGYYGNPTYFGNCWVDRYAVRRCVR